MFNKHRIEYFLFAFLGNVLTLFGYKSVRFSSKLLAFFVFHILRIRRNVVIKNLGIAFPQLTNTQLKKLAKKNYESSALTLLEIFYLSKTSKEKVIDLFSLEEFGIIREKFNKNNGLIILTGHFGNWEIAALATGIYLNESINVLVKKQRNPFVTKWLKKFRERFGNTQIALGSSVRELYTAIKQKKIVGIVGDQRGKKEGIKVDFFGRETSTFPGTASIALKTQCPVLFVFCARQSNGSYKFIINEMDYSNLVGSAEERTQQFNQLYMNALERTIKEYPEQWFWMHNIWKY